MSHAAMTQDRILELIEGWANAEHHGDFETLDMLLDTDFVCVGPLGYVINKQQYLAGRRSGDLKQQEFIWKEVQIRVYRDAAVAVGSQVQRSTFQGRDASGCFRATLVLVRKGEGWLVISLHLSPIPPAPGWIVAGLQVSPGAHPQRAESGAR